MNLTDRCFSAMYLLLSAALVVFARRVPDLATQLLISVAVLAVIAVTARFAHHGTAWRFAHDWYPIFLFIVAFEQVARLSLVFVPHWQEHYLVAFESRLFAQMPTAWLNQWRSPWLIEALEFGYFTFYWLLPLAGGLLYAKTWNRPEARESREPFRVWMDATVVGYLFCYAVYLLFPTRSPAHHFGMPFAATIPAGLFRWLVLLIQHEGGVHGNAFLSGHVMAGTVALLALLRWERRWGLWLIAPVVLMCVGCVYDGYHFVSDVVAGAAVGAAAFYGTSAAKGARCSTMRDGLKRPLYVVVITRSG